MGFCASVKGIASAGLKLMDIACNFENCYNLIKFNKLGLEMQLFLEVATKKGYKEPSKSSIEASFKGVSFQLGWGGKLETTLED